MKNIKVAVQKSKRASAKVSAKVVTEQVSASAVSASESEQASALVSAGASEREGQLTMEQVSKGMLMMVEYIKSAGVSAGKYIAVVESVSASAGVSVRFDYSVWKAKHGEYVRASESAVLSASASGWQHNSEAQGKYKEVKGIAVSVRAITDSERAEWKVKMDARAAFMASKASASVVKSA